MEWINKDAEISDIVKKGIRSLPQRVNKLKEAIKDKNVKKIKYYSHNLKGIASNLHMEEIYLLSKQLCEEAQKEKYNKKNIDKILTDIETICFNIPNYYLKK
ncbi:MAG: Hpt domain-containing protein [Halanaerobiales bacterium]|nr:Hpt domain-containing protein [Halanaerobiales bacterium]